MNDVSAGQTPLKSRNQSKPREWPYKARALADDLLDMCERLGERSIAITSQANEIDVLISSAIRMIEMGDDPTAINELRKVLGKTTMQRHESSDVLVSVASAAKRLAWAIVGKYE